LNAPDYMLDPDGNIQAIISTPGASVSYGNNFSHGLCELLNSWSNALVQATLNAFSETQ
jgi:hypothetical protein